MSQSQKTSPLAPAQVGNVEDKEKVPSPITAVPASSKALNDFDFDLDDADVAALPKERTLTQCESQLDDDNAEDTVSEDVSDEIIELDPENDEAPKERTNPHPA